MNMAAGPRRSVAFRYYSPAMECASERLSCTNPDIRITV
jgi:hypothetical protein